jgi:DNA repair exonuclease SbcCD ATPase subunit
MNRNTLDHEKYRELVAMAATGQLSALEHEELQSHLAACSDCRAELAGYEDLAFQYLPVMLPEAQDSLPINSDDFLLRPSARNGQGALKQKQRSRSSSSWPTISPFYRYAPPIAACTLLAAGVFGVAAWQTRQKIEIQATALAAASGKNAQLNEQIARLQAGHAETSSVFQSKLSESSQENARLSEQVKALTQQLASASARVQDLLNQVDSDQGRESSLSTKLKDDEQKIAQLGSDLQAARTERNERASVNNSNDATELERQKGHLKELETSLAAESESIERERKLLAADRDIRDLMGARNLHILDVFDLEGNGQPRKAFGRVFYTEGKSLIFYAFDLGKDKKKHASSMMDASFQAWGAQEYNHQFSQNLGIFYQDDQKDNRWVLKFTDPSVLAEINYVFVTLEPTGGSKKPTGPKLLYAYLNSGINHP